MRLRYRRVGMFGPTFPVICADGVGQATDGATSISANAATAVAHFKVSQSQDRH
jgi:hypothetical protein